MATCEEILFVKMYVIITSSERVMKITNCFVSWVFDWQEKVSKMFLLPSKEKNYCSKL